MDKQRFTHVSLFSGAGGLDIGFENVGFASQEGRSLTGVRIETKSPSLIALRRAKTPPHGGANWNDFHNEREYQELLAAPFVGAGIETKARLYRPCTAWGRSLHGNMKWNKNKKWGLDAHSELVYIIPVLKSSFCRAMHGTSSFRLPRELVITTPICYQGTYLLRGRCLFIYSLLIRQY